MYFFVHRRPGGKAPVPTLLGISPSSQYSQSRSVVVVGGCAVKVAVPRSSPFRSRGFSLRRVRVRVQRVLLREVIRVERSWREGIVGMIAVIGRMGGLEKGMRGRGIRGGVVQSIDGLSTRASSETLIACFCYFWSLFLRICVFMYGILRRWPKILHRLMITRQYPGEMTKKGHIISFYLLWLGTHHRIESGPLGMWLRPLYLLAILHPWMFSND